ncbi:MAG: DNA cytosine methyltransferase [Treponema sp.]|nr:DNA cytosine methyltransferase [Treponema sp.]
MNQLNIIDMFCGGGGESTGLISAAHEYDFDVNMSAINHWERAIETHAANYPFAEHRIEDVQTIKPESLKASVNTDLLWASPGCQHFSVARGGKPRNEQLRAPAWEVLRFVETIRPKRVIIENVPEFQTWGPLTEDGKVIQSQKGKTFNAFIHALQSLNYIASYKVLCAADYGAPTSRRRLFIQAVRKDCGKRIVWPKVTNVKDGDMFLPKWRAASEIIDWSIPCQLIKDRKKPLANATLKRIEYGIREFWGDYAEPFIAKLYGNSNAESINNPLSTISCSGAHHMLIQPFVTAIGQTSAKNRSRTLDKPLSTICTKQEHCLVQPFITEYYGNGGVHPIGIPLPTITTKDRFAVCGVTDGIELGFRMLQPKELAAATGFPADYKFTGTKVEVVKQIGNAVPPNFAKALFSQILKGL